MNFASDNIAGAAAPVLDALVKGAGPDAPPALPYGSDPVTARVQAALDALFERETTAFPVATGTAANALALAALCPPYGTVYCHRHAHIEEDECGAPEFFTGGAKLTLIDGPDGKITPAALADTLACAGAGVVHHVQPAAVSLTQATECGTVYTIEELAALSRVAHAYGLPVHLDGARFANAVATLGCTAAEMTWKAGIDVVSFGATKNGCLAAEAVVFFTHRDQATAFGFRRKRAGHLFSKMRTISLQLEAYLADGLWLELARTANARARSLHDGLTACAGIEPVFPLGANVMFLKIPKPVADGLRADGFVFIPRGGEDVYRLVTPFNADPAAIDAMIARAAALTAGRQAAE